MLKLLERTHIRVESLAVLAGLIVIMALFSPTTGSGVRVFLTANNFFNIILATATFGILAIGATFVISAAGIDLSLGSVLGLASVSGAALVRNTRMAVVFRHHRRARRRSGRRSRERIHRNAWSGTGVHRNAWNARNRPRPRTDHLQRPGHLRASG